MRPRDPNDSSNDLIIGNLGGDHIYGASGNDHIYGDLTSDTGPGGSDQLFGGDGIDRLYGGAGTDMLSGGAGDDFLAGGAGSDDIWGGDKDNDQGAADGIDTLDYSALGAAVAISFHATGGAALTIADGSDPDTFHSIERILGTAQSDTLAFTGSGANPRVDMTDLADGYALVSQNGVALRLKGIETFVGGAALTIFIGNGDVGRETIFRAGSGGGDFTLKSGNRAYGYDGAVDTFRVTTTVPAEFAAYSDAQKVEYLRQNRVFIGNFGAEDRIYVDGVLFDGNRVTSQIAPVRQVLPNADVDVTSIWLTGDSSYDTLYPHAQFENRGVNDASYVFGANQTFRDVDYRATDESGIGLISFQARTGQAHPESRESFELNPLGAQDGMLTIVIGGFSHGEGGISFTHDSLSSAFSHNGNVSVNPGDVTNPMRLHVSLQYDVIDGVADGWVYGGGATVDSGDARFHFGERAFAGAGMDWQAFALGAEALTGTEGDDQLAGGVGDDAVSGLEGGDQLAGDGGSDLLDGGAGDDQLAGGVGDDLLDGGIGRDAMAGGLGDDSYRVDDLGDVVTEYAGEGRDSIVTSLASYALQAELENLFYSGTGSFSGTGNDADNRMAGGDGDDALSGGGGKDSFESLTGADAIDGGDGDDVMILDGYRYRYDFARDGAGVITVTDHENPREIVLTSVESVYFAGTEESWGLEDLFGYYGTEGDDEIVGNGVDNALFGLGGSDTLSGAGGNDLLNGGIGADAMSGEMGDDTYYVDNAGDAIMEAADGGYDVVVSSLAYTLGADLESLELSGTGTIDGTGNALDNELYGNAAANLLRGLAGADLLEGGDGDDTLDGGAGNDVMEGGLGNDLYLVDSLGDIVTEAASEGQDRVDAGLSYALGAGQSVEILAAADAAGGAAINLTGNMLAQEMIGNAGANVLHGGGGADLLRGLGGDDVYYVDVAAAQVAEAVGGGTDIVYASLSYVLAGGAAVETLSVNSYGATQAINLTGNAYAQTLIGNAGANVLHGGGGMDSLIGLGGNDVYYVDVAAVAVVEAAGGGADIVYASSSYALGGGEVETLSVNSYGATQAINLTGNAYAQTLIGNAGANVLHGGGGVDTLIGLGGNDVYYVDVAGTQIGEAGGGGADAVYSSIGYALAAGCAVETLSANDYGATSAIGLTGNGFAQALTGNAGANRLDGGAGADTLYGLGGADNFAFTTALGGGNVDYIADFSAADDTIQLDDAIFAAIGGPGALAAAAFHAGAAAHDADDRIIYNSATGQLFYDADGNGAGAAVQFATLAGAPALTASDFQVI